MAKKSTSELDGATPTESLTQKEAVKRAIAAGKDMPKDGVSYIKDTFGMDLSTQAFSTLKTQLKGGSGSSGKRGRPVGSTNGKAAASKSSANHSNPADLARQVKSLVAQHGAAVVKGMVEVFSER